MKEWSHVHELSGPTQKTEREALRGTWGAKVILELGCGAGDYSLALAAAYPDATVIGVDIKGSRLWHGAKRALDLKLPNAHFIRMRIEDLADCFAELEVDEIWITFPDPRPTKGDAKRRLTSPRFLEIYQKILKPDGLVHLKTDDRGLWEYTIETCKSFGFILKESFESVHEQSPEGSLLRTTLTAYEKRYLSEGKAIFYLLFSL